MLLGWGVGVDLILPPPPPPPPPLLWARTVSILTLRYTKCFRWHAANHIVCVFCQVERYSRSRYPTKCLQSRTSRKTQVSHMKRRQLVRKLLSGTSSLHHREQGKRPITRENSPKLPVRTRLQWKVIPAHPSPHPPPASSRLQHGAHCLAPPRFQRKFSNAEN
jgi:hypothetical protein